MKPRALSIKRTEVRSPLARSRYQIFPPHTPDVHEAMEQSILNNEVENATVWDDEENLLDGWERWNICASHGIRCPREVRHFDSESDKFRFILAVNSHRRPAMSQKQKRAVIEAYLIGDPEIADNALGQALGVSKNTVLKYRKILEAARKIKKVTMTKGKDGKVRPVTYTKRIITSTQREYEKAVEIVKDLPDHCAGKTLDISTAKRRAAMNRNKVEREARIIEPLRNDSIQLYHCPFQELEQRAEMMPASANLVLTDIPYGKDFLQQLDDLACFAERVLVDGGLFVTLAGQYWLPKVMEALSRKLVYRWMSASVWNGRGTLVHIGNTIISKWKPILVYSKGECRKRGQWCDVVQVNQQEKDWHPWQQPLEEVEMLVRYFSEPGELVVDPCGGGFTTAEACLRLNRRCISCDVVPESVEKGIERNNIAMRSLQSQIRA